MILLYRILTLFFFPLIILIVYFRKLIGKEDQKRYKEKIFSSNFDIKEKENRSNLIWFHAASIGEMKSILPIIEELNKHNQNLNFLLTTVTLSSANIAKLELVNFKNVTHRFFPVDVEFLMKKFLELWKPDFIFFVDSEIWPNLILSAKKKKIPLILINARITSKSFKKWMLFPNTAKSIFSLFDLCLTSNNQTKDHLQKLKGNNIHYTGNIKFIKRTSGKLKNTKDQKLLGDINFWVAVSTHRNEEEFCLDTHLILKNKISNVKTFIAPRHIERVNEIENLCKKYNLSCQILNKEDNINISKEIIIINSFGILPKYLRCAKSVFMGKSTLEKLKNDGGQNPIEAANLGCKIYHGRFIYNFEEIYKILSDNNISQLIENPQDLANNLQEDLKTTNKDIEKFSQTMINLSEKTLSETMLRINNILENENFKT